MTELTPERLRDYYVVSCNTPIQRVEIEDSAESFADAWDRDRRVKNGAINFLKHKISDLNLAKKSLVEERDRLHGVLQEVNNQLQKCGYHLSVQGDIDRALANTEKRDD